MGKKNKKNKKKENTKKMKANRPLETNNTTKIKKPKIKKKQSKLRLFVKIVVVLFVLLIIIGSGIIAGILLSDDWSITKEDLTLSQINTTIYDKNEVEIASVSGDEKRRVVHLDDMPKYLKDAFISIEDETFEKHHGINLKRTVGATVMYILNRGNGASYGGSTITQQLIKNLKNDKDSSGIEGIKRKIREISRAYQVEKILSKDQILELYLNLIFMGGDVYGVELGSQYYFAKSCTELDLAESAFLAGINNAPNSYNPYGETDNTDLIKRRTKIVLGKMKELGKINEEEYNTAVEKVNEGFKFEKGSVTSGNAMSYLARAALNQVIEQYAEEKDLTWQYAKTKIESGGFKIYTTQDSTIQGIMEVVYKNNDYIASGREKDKDGNLKNKHVQSAMVIIDHTTGKVVGCMGGMGDDVDSFGLNRATSTRQPGSAIKPIASIAPALESGIITASTVYNEASSYFGNYHPTSSGLGLITVRKAIEVSANTTEVKIMSELGPRNSIAFLRKMGVSSLVTAAENPEVNDESLPMVLGGLTYGISPLEMAGAYACIANDGVYITPTFYTRVEDNKGEVILEPEQQKNRVMSEGNSFVLQSILTGPVGGGGTAPYCKISNQSTGGKTGTTTSNKDRWFCGFTSYYTAATWYGYDQPEPTHSSTNPAARLWASIMSKIHTDLPSASFEKPSNVVSVRVCKDSGKAASDECKNTYVEYFVRGTVPDKCEGHKILTICTDTGKIANENCPHTEEKVYTEKPEKEKTTLWRTTSNDEYKVPDEVCDTHTKVVVKLPNVVGLKKDEAEKKLKALKLNVTVQTKESDKESGIVLTQSKAAGTEIAEGESITITVSRKKSSTPSSGGNTINTNTQNGGNTVNSNTASTSTTPENPVNKTVTENN